MLYFPKTIFKIISFFLIFNFAVILADADAKKIDRLKKKAADINQKIKTNKAKVKKFAKKEANVLETLNEMDVSLNKARKKVKTYKKDLAFLDKKTQSAQSRFDELQKQIEINESYAARRVSGLYKLTRLGKINILINAESVLDYFQRKRALEQILDYDNTTIEDLKKQKIECSQTADKLAEQIRKYRDLEEKYQKQVKELNNQQAQRKKLLSSIRKKKSLAKASIASLRKSSKKLDKKIKSLQVIRKTNDKKTSTGVFKSFKGLLNMPVKGKIISSFGPYKNAEFNVMNIQSGIDIKAENGTPIRSVMKGEVIYSSWFKGYGNMIIIDHGDHYYSLYAHAEELYKNKGDKVQTGEVIATVGDSGSMSGPGLHFEIRHHGKPVDPGKWLKKG